MFPLKCLNACSTGGALRLWLAIDIICINVREQLSLLFYAFMSILCIAQGLLRLTLRRVKGHHSQ